MRNSQQHICALIPTFNNGGTILDVVRRVHSFVRDVIIVDDGSTDDTPQLLATLDFEVTVVTHTRNKGKGAALKSGFKKAIELGFDYALTIDADGQHYPEDIPLLLKALDVHPNNLIVGVRQFTDANMSSKSKFANKFSNFWFRLQTTINLPDTQSGFRIYPLRRLYGLSLLTNRYEAELELLVSPRGIIYNLFRFPFVSIIRRKSNVSVTSSRRKTLPESVSLTVSYASVPCSLAISICIGERCSALPFLAC